MPPRRSRVSETINHLNTTWYLHSHLVRLRLLLSSIVILLLRVLGSSRFGVSPMDSHNYHTSTATLTGSGDFLNLVT